MTSTSGTIPSVNLGAHGPRVGTQGLGTMAMATGVYGDTDEREAVATLEHALESGVTLFDTADMYGDGRGEQFVGQFARRHRDEIILATKFAFVLKEGTQYEFSLNNRPEYIRSAVDASLRRLGIDVIDLYYMHRRDPEVPLADSIGAMADLVAAGKVRYLGLSEVTGAELREAHAIHPIAAIQSEWSLFSRDVELTSVPVAAELGIAFVPYSPLGRGMLTGAIQSTNFDASDVRGFFPRFGEGAFEANAALVAEIGKIAQARGASAAQVALAWVYSRADLHGLTVVPIPGTRKRSRLDENLGALDVSLMPEDLQLLDQLAKDVQGGRPV
jgi:aryl-alcohol dehydrogenase-like predicted oxidoreductase